MDKREMIERALGPFVSRGWKEELALKGWEFYKDDFLDALAEQAIVIPIRVRHIVSGQIGKPERTVEITKISLGYEHLERGWIDMPTEEIGGHHGIPGKALAIILPLEEDFEEFVMRETEAAIEGGIIDEETGLPFDLEEGR